MVGYCDELTPYVPSLRVLREGGYEGTDSLPEYGYPAAFKESIEERMANAVERLMNETSPSKPAYLTYFVRSTQRNKRVRKRNCLVACQKRNIRYKIRPFKLPMDPKWW